MMHRNRLGFLIMAVCLSVETNAFGSRVFDDCLGKWAGKGYMKSGDGTKGSFTQSLEVTKGGDSYVVHEITGMKFSGRDLSADETWDLKPLTRDEYSDIFSVTKRFKVVEATTGRLVVDAKQEGFAYCFGQHPTCHVNFVKASIPDYLSNDTLECHGVNTRVVVWNTTLHNKKPNLMFGQLDAVN